MAKPFRFGVQMSKPPAGETWQSAARHVEDLGYSTLTLPDHFEDQLAPIPAMMSAAEATTTLKVGVLVLDNDYRHPVVLAKEIATIDVLSGGRVELGLGAGWLRTDYDQSGIPYDPPGVRVSRFEESIAVIGGLFGEGVFSFEGEHYQIAGLNGLPKPIQPGGPKLMVGGGGRRVLSLAGRHADIISINPNMAAGAIGADTAQDALADQIDQKLAWVKAAAGDRFDEIEISTTLFLTQVTDDADSVLTNVSALFGTTPEEVAQTPIAAIGTTSQIADALQARRDRWGYSYIFANSEGFEALAPVVAELAGQ
jgi:probable F420-dependent oxidoreductase